MNVSADLSLNLDAYDAMAGELEQAHFGQWVAFQRGKLLGIYSTQAEAQAAGGQRQIKEPAYVRQVGPEKGFYWLPTPVFPDDCFDADGNPDLAKWRQLPVPPLMYRPVGVRSGDWCPGEWCDDADR